MPSIPPTGASATDWREAILAAAGLSHLFSPIRIRGLEIKNRILSTGHDTTLITGGVPNDALIAYHEARAKGGAGLIIVQVAGIHETARYTSHVLMATEDDACPAIAGWRRPCTSHGCKIFGQLFHPGREIMESQDGSAPVAYAPSAVPNERFHVMPRPMSKAHDRRESSRAMARPRGGCAAPASTAARSWRATAICRRSSSTRASTGARTSMAERSRTACASCAR